MSGYPERTNPVTTPDPTPTPTDVERNCGCGFLPDHARGDVTTPDPTPTTSDIERILADGRHAIRCGCGLVVVSDDQETNLEVFAAHECPPIVVESAPEVDHWYYHVFSPWGWIILGVIAYSLIKVLGHGK